MSLRAVGRTLADAALPSPLRHPARAHRQRRLRQRQHPAEEIELSTAFGVSRITAKRALDELAVEGLVERARGRGTTVMRAPGIAGAKPISASIDGLRESLSVIGRETVVQVIEFG